jgi:hypothetical protein
LPETDGAGDSLSYQRTQSHVIDLFRRDQADGNLGRAAVQRRSQPPPALIAHMNKRSGRRIRLAGKVRSIYPGMSATQASSSALIDLYDWSGVGQNAPRARLE